jgi:hypothetical protein
VAIYWGNILFPIHRDWDKIIENILLKFQKIGKNFPISSIIFSSSFATNCSPKAPPFFILFSEFLLIHY